MERIKKRMDHLCEILNYHNYKYYVENSPEISDHEYDILYKELIELEKNHPQFKRQDSPTQRVGGEPLDGFKTVRHKVPMLSIDNTYSKEELKEFDKRIQKWLGHKSGYVVELKIDGVAISLLYENGIFCRGVTRGDGFEGDDITENLKTIKSLPLSISMNDKIEVRGEIYMKKNDFERLNKERNSRGEVLFANPRNATAGSLKLLDPKTVAKRGLTLFVYAGFLPDGPKTQWELLNHLERLEFPVNPVRKLAGDINGVMDFCDEWEEKRKSLPYGIDGLVIKINSLDDQDALGVTTKSARWMVAYKYQPEQASTTVEKIIVQVGRTGILTPVASLSPVFISGTTVTRATLHNFDEIERLDVREGDRVFVEKSGEVIPKVIRVIKDTRKGNEIEFLSPSECPVCGSSVVRDTGEVALRCPNVRCPAQIKERIIHFALRDAMSIEGLGDKIVDMLVDRGFISDYGDLYSLKERDKELQDVERMGEKSVNNLLSAIEESKKRPLKNLIFALGIRHVGVHASEILASRFSSIDEIKKEVQNGLNISEIGPVIEKSIKDFFDEPENVKLLEKMKNAAVNMERTEEEKIKSTMFSGKKFVVTGTLKNFSRAEIEEFLKQRDATVSETVSKKTDYLIAGENPGSKIDKAKRLGVKIITGEELMDFSK
ncbi:MAG: NAD-dependent DNA ligase LigA [Candidatus Omnitrophica bacterium]|nr:NAD-dependent DNA ligase LigA [Candidatus Omnitrophota bacterium]